MRSRAVNLPLACCAEMRCSPPPRRARARRLSRRARICFIGSRPSERTRVTGIARQVQGRNRRQMRCRGIALRWTGDTLEMTYPLRAYPALRQSDVENAKLLADRYELIKWLAKHNRYAVIAEIGVARGDFSEFLMDAFRPSSFVAFDTFK